MSGEKKSLAMEMFGKPEKMLDYYEYTALEKAKRVRNYKAELKKLDGMSDEERDAYIVSRKKKHMEYLSSRSAEHIEYEKKYRHAYYEAHKKTTHGSK